MSSPGAWTQDARTELFIAILRVGVFVALAAIFWSDDFMRGQHGALVSLTGLGLAAIASFVFAILRYDRWWLPWIFATFDVGLFLHCVLRAVVSSELPLDSLLTAPGIWLFAVYLSIAAIRHQPSLIAYYSAFLIAGLTFVYVIAPEASVTDVGSANHPMEGTSAAAQVVVAAALVLSLVFVAWRLKLSVATSATERRARKSLSRHFARKIVDRILALPAPDSLHQHMAAVMFVDICGFTALAEATPSRQLVDLIVEFRTRVVRIVEANGGLVEKFLGDGMLVVFGAVDQSSHDARAAVQCTIQIRQHLLEWRSERLAAGLPAIEAGIGLHYGSVYCGILGSGDRVEFTVVGDTVNVAARAQQKANTLGGWSVLSESVLAAAQIDMRSLSGEWLPMERLKGKRHEVRLYGMPPASMENDAI